VRAFRCTGGRNRIEFVDRGGSGRARGRHHARAEFGKRCIACGKFNPATWRVGCSLASRGKRGVFRNAGVQPAVAVGIQRRETVTGNAERQPVTMARVLNAARREDPLGNCLP
jgi:hypothetical protein